MECLDFVFVVSMLHVCSSEMWYCGEWGGVVFIRCVVYGRGCVYVVYKQCPWCMCGMCVYVKTVYGMCVLYRYCGVCVVFDLCDVYFVYVMCAC